MLERLKLARVRWYLGQSLLPEHLMASEQAMSAESHVRGLISGRPEFGLVRLRWNDLLLAEGVLQLSEATVVLRDGTLLDVPRAATVGPLTLAMTGAARVPVYLHVLDQTDLAAGNPLYVDDPKVVQRVIRKAQLATTERLERSVGALKLAEFEKSASGVWSLSGAYLPPLLRVGDSPFLQVALQQIALQLGELDAKLVASLKDTFLRLERLAVIRASLAVIYETLSLLSDLRQGHGGDPYALFRQLRQLYFQLCCLHEVVPEQSNLPYLHGDATESFGRLLQLLGPRLRLQAQAHSYVQFQKQDSLFSLPSLPDELKAAQEVYLLVQRPNLNEPIRIGDVKLAATSRLALVHRMVMRGVPFKHVEQVHFQHSFGPEVDFYQLTLNDEWGIATREGSLGFNQTAALAKAQCFLFWR